jgi:tRNA pseudouridine55 synthase
MVREGEAVELAARRVTISRIDVFSVRPVDDLLDVDVEVACSSGTYIRAIARDLGAALRVGGHLVGLRRTAVGGFTLGEASTLEELADIAEAGGDPVGLPLAQAIERAMPVRTVGDEEAKILSHGGPLAPAGIPGAYGILGPDGTALAVVRETGGRARPEVVFAPA